jgi:hypothetical protein
MVNFKAKASASLQKGWTDAMWIGYWKTYGMPIAEREIRFHPTRKWRLDMGWRGPMVAVDIQGGNWVGGAHVRPKGYLNDREKIREAQRLGWTVLEVTWDQVTSGELVTLAQQALLAAARRVRKEKDAETKEDPDGG